MSGYCAIGSPGTMAPPIRTMRMAMTIAITGLRAKKLPIAISLRRGRGVRLGRRDALRGGRRGRRRRGDALQLQHGGVGGLRRPRLARPHLAHAVDDDALVDLQPVVDD